MEVLFKCLQDGMRYYAVRRGGQELFVGSGEECKRYLDLHTLKVKQQLLDDKRTPRQRPVSIRTYRQTRTTA